MTRVIMEDDPPAQRMADLPRETRDFLTNLSHEDIKTIEMGLPVLRLIIGFGKVSKWLAIGGLGLMVGLVLFMDTLQRILGFFKPPSH